MARVYYSGGSVNRTTTTSTTYGDHCSITFTPNASKVYALFWGCLLDHSATTSDCRGRLYHDTAAAALQTFNFEPQDITDKFQVAGASIYTAPGSPTSQTFSVEFSAEAGTSGCQDSWIVALELVSGESYAQGTTTGYTNVAYTTVASASSTTSGTEYVIIGSGEIANSAVNASNLFELYDGWYTTTLRTTGPPYTQDTTNFTPWWVIEKITADFNGAAYEMRMRSDGVASVSAQNVTIILLKSTAFDDVIYGESIGSSTTNSSTAQTKLTVTDTPLAQEYLQLFACSRQEGDTTESALTDYTRAGAAISVEASREANNISEWYDHGYGAVSTLSASSTTWLVRYRAETSSFTYITNAVMVGLALAEPASGLPGVLRAGGVIPTSA